MVFPFYQDSDIRFRFVIALTMIVKVSAVVTVMASAIPVIIPSAVVITIRSTVMITVPAVPKTTRKTCDKQDNG
jgi:hypothetical protein